MAGRAIDRLKKAANLKPTRRTIVLSDGSEFEFWSKPLTMAEREKAQKDAGTDDVNQYALQLLVAKAQDEKGSRLFSPGDIADLKNSTRDEDVQAMMLAMLAPGEEEPLDMKSSRAGD